MKLRAATAVAVLFPLAAAAGPDAEEGHRLVQQHKCESCHQDKVYGPAGTIYVRRDRKATTLAKLKAQVSACNVMLGIGLFPEEEEKVSAYLNEAFYKLPEK